MNACLQSTFNHNVFFRVEKYNYNKYKKYKKYIFFVGEM